MPKKLRVPQSNQQILNDPLASRPRLGRWRQVPDPFDRSANESIACGSGASATDTLNGALSSSTFAPVMMRTAWLAAAWLVSLSVKLCCCLIGLAAFSACTTLTVGRIEGRSGVTADGAATYEIPIWVSPGRAGIEPVVTLSYNSQSGNGWLGPGWSLAGFPQITRCRRTLAKDGDAREIQFIDGSAGDRYCLDGQRLVVSGGSLGSLSVYGADGTEYRTEYDRHAKIISNAPDAYGPTSFTVYLKNGQVLTFGATATSRLDGKRTFITTGAGSSVTPQGWTEDHSTTIRYLWALEETRDRSGNYLRVEYQLDEDDFGYDLRPASINYTGFTAPTGSVVPSSPPNRSVDFIYEDRPDSVETFISGLRLLRGKRLSRIDVRGPSLTRSNFPLRVYEMGYALSQSTGRSLLTSVRECDGIGICKPPTVFNWTDSDFTFTDNVMASLTVGNAITKQSDDPNPPLSWAASWQVADVNGDGRDDLLGVGTAPLLANTGPFGDPLIVPPGATLVTGAVGYFEGGRPLPPDRYIDLNGDGIPDRITLEAPPLPSGPPGVSGPSGLRRNAIYLSGPQGFSRLNDVQTYSRLTRPAYALDLDGDGLADLVQPIPFFSGGSDYVWQYRLNSGGTFGPWITTTVPAWMPGTLSRPDPLFGLAFDPNGSGKLGLLLSADELLRLGAAGLEKATVTLPVRDYCDPLFLDLNGDGLLDWLARGPGATIATAINTGNGFKAPVMWTLPGPYQTAFPRWCDPDYAGSNGVRVIDFDGDGRQDLLLMAGWPKMVVLLADGKGGFVPVQLDIRRG